MFIFSSIKTPKIQYIILSDDGQFHTKLITNSDNVIHYILTKYIAFLRASDVTFKIKSCSISCIVGHIQLQIVHKNENCHRNRIVHPQRSNTAQNSSSSSTDAQNKRYF